VLAAEWYAGDLSEPYPEPIDRIKIPSDYCGALDFGVFSNGKLALVEAQHPYACGWYGKDHEKYCQWIIDGWIYMSK
jgi:hypothetical protein